VVDVGCLVLAACCQVAHAGTKSEANRHL
jgi:hypothetical protein